MTVPVCGCNRITTAGYSYDLNGNLTAMPGVSNIGYDVFDRIASITKSGSTSTAKYDAFGRRIERAFASGARWVYFYDMSGRLGLRVSTPLPLGGNCCD